MVAIMEPDYQGICFKCDRQLTPDNWEISHVGLTDEEFRLLMDAKIMPPGQLEVIQHKECPPRYPKGFD